MISAIINMIVPDFNPDNCTLPDLPSKAIPTATPKTVQSGSRRLPGEARVFELDPFITDAKSRKKSPFTPIEQGYLDEAGMKNTALNAAVKKCRDNDMTAPEALAEIRLTMPAQKASLSYVQKIYAALSKADRAVAENSTTR